MTLRLFRVFSNIGSQGGHAAMTVGNKSRTAAEKFLIFKFHCSQEYVCYRTETVMSNQTPSQGHV